MLKKLCAVALLPFLASGAVANTLGDEVCYTPLRGSASTTNVNAEEQIGWFNIVIKRVTPSDEMPKFMRLNGQLRGEIVGSFDVEIGGTTTKLPILNHVLRSRGDLIFTGPDTLTSVSPTSDPCYADVEETLLIDSTMGTNGTGRFASLTGGAIVVSGEVYSVNEQNAAYCANGLVGSVNDFVVEPVGSLCFATSGDN